MTAAQCAACVAFALLAVAFAAALVLERRRERREEERVRRLLEKL